MYLAMDMGTSSTRLWLCDGDSLLGEKKARFGASLGLREKKEALFERLRALISELLSENNASEKDVEFLIGSGMAGCEFALCEVEHLTVPSDAYSLSEGIKSVKIPEIADFPFLIVPGLKTTLEDKVLDIMRGEETETLGIIEKGNLKLPSILVLPGTHNKIIEIDEKGKITDFHTTMSGEILDLTVRESILKNSLSHDFDVSEHYVHLGAEYSQRNGVNAALFRIRTLSKSGLSEAELSSFLYGAVIGQDLELIRKFAKGKAIYVGGSKNLKKAYCLLLENDGAYPLGEELSSNAVRLGLNRITKIFRLRNEQDKIRDLIENTKVIAIIRNPDEKTLIDAAEALYKGGIRLLEVTFDRQLKTSAEKTCELISKLCQRFRGRMYVGAGTVTDCSLVRLAVNAGASFIISPNCDRDVISLTKNLGAVSIPAAYTPTEITEALNFGADYVKLFPADDVSREYVKAVTAPLSDAKLIAVGGVTPDNAGKFIENGFIGVGVGSNLYDKKLIAQKDFDALTDLAKSFSSAINGTKEN